MSHIILPRHEFLQCTNYDSNLGNYRAKDIVATGGQRFTFQIPYPLKAIKSIKLLGNVSAGAAGVDRDIDFYFSWHQPGQAYDAGNTSDTTTLYNLSAYANKTYSFNFTSILTGLVSHDLLGLFVDHIAIGGAIRYFGIELIYYPIEG